MSDLTADDIVASCAPKSDQLNADDLIAGPLTGRIVRMTRGSAEQPINVYLDSTPRPWRPCKSERRIMIGMWGKDPAGWVGQAVRLVRDPTATWAGAPVGGIRIEAATIPRPFSLAVALSRKDRVQRTIGVLRVDAPPDRLANALRDAGWYDDAVSEFGERPTWDDAAVKAWASARKAAQAATP